MSLIEEAENFRWKKTGQKIIEGAKTIGMIDIDLKFVETLRYFDIISFNQMKDKETMRKIQTIYEHFKNSDDILKDIRELDSNLGNPIDLGEKLNKIYSHIYSLNLEKGFQKEKEIQDKRTAEMIERGKKEREIANLKKEKEARRERLAEIERAKKEEKEKRREDYLRAKKEKEVEERIKIIEKTKPPKLPEIPKIKL